MKQVCARGKRIHARKGKIDKSDLELAGKLAQRNYDEKLLSEVEKQLKNIQNIIKNMKNKKQYRQKNYIVSMTE